MFCFQNKDNRAQKSYIVEAELRARLVQPRSQWVGGIQRRVPDPEIPFQGKPAAQTRPTVAGGSEGRKDFTRFRSLAGEVSLNLPEGGESIYLRADRTTHE